MGLGTTHDCWYGAYSAFDRWRTLLTAAVGPQWAINWDAITEANLQGDWDHLPEDPLVVLIAHSDCDGRIVAEACLPLAIRLEQLAESLPTEGAGHLINPRVQTLQFAAGLRQAAASGEDVEFR